MKQFFSLTALGLALALGSAQAQTMASAPASAALIAPVPAASLTPAPVATPATGAATPASPAISAHAAAPRPLSRTSRTRGKVVQAAPIKVCSVRVNTKKGEDRTASLSACIKE